MPELAERFFRGERRPFIFRLRDYIELRIKGGLFRPVPDAATTARFVLETVSWFANHRYGDQDSAMITDELAEETVVDMLTAALVKPGR